MIMVRIVAVLVIAALVLIVVFFVTRNRRYLRWSWRTLLAALVGIFAVMMFYLVERLFFAG